MSSSPSTITSTGTTLRSSLRTSALWIGRILLAGALCGLVIGGVGGRLAMFVLRLTSPDSLRGLETDDEFEIGVFSSATIFLLLFCTVLGLFGAFTYVLARQWLPARTRMPVFAAIGATLGGAGTIRTDGLDFTLLEPLELAVAMFIALPALYGGALVWLSERFLASSWWDRHRFGWVVFLPFLPVLALGFVGLVVVPVAALLMAFVPRYPRLLAAWQSPVLAWLGRAAITVLIVVAGSRLVDDVTTVL